MGGIVKSIFGGSSNKTESKNVNNSLLTGALGPALGYTTQGGNALASLLGLSGGGAQTAAQANFRSTPGYQFTRDEGIRGVVDKYAARGLGNSGAAMRGVARYSSGLADQTYNNYLSQLLGFSNLGTQAGSVLADTGRVSSGSGSESSGGLGKAIGLGLSLLSDRHLKTDIEDTGESWGGLKIYEFSYIWDHATRHKGFMADEVRVLYPEAVFDSGGFDRVNYGMIFDA